MPRPAGYLEDDCTLDRSHGSVQVDYVNLYGEFAPVSLRINVGRISATQSCDDEGKRCIGVSGDSLQNGEVKRGRPRIPTERG